jgi:hypothetical protein
MNVTMIPSFISRQITAGRLSLERAQYQALHNMAAWDRIGVWAIRMGANKMYGLGLISDKVEYFILN